MSRLRRELPYSLVIGVPLLVGIWLVGRGSTAGLWLMAVGVVVAVVRAAVTTRSGLRRWHETRGG